MKEVQLDKNSYARRLRDDCNQEGNVKCCAPPHDLLDAADDDVIAFAKPQGRLLLTFDRAIGFDRPDALIRGFPGILILALEDNSVKRMGRKIAMSLLHQFKSECSDWPTFDCSNSVVELQPNIVLVYHVEGQSLLLSALFDRRTAGWQEALKNVLATNASRSYQ